jgi:hypothetical protein
MVEESLLYPENGGRRFSETFWRDLILVSSTLKMKVAGFSHIVV